MTEPHDSDAVVGANPFKLADYATEGEEQHTPLRNLVNDASDAIRELRNADSEIDIATADPGDLLDEVVPKLEAVDRHVRRVANNFLRLNPDLMHNPTSLGTNPVVYATVGELGAGWADPEDARQAARENASEIERILDNNTDWNDSSGRWSLRGSGDFGAEEFSEAFETITYGQNDPYFAAALAEELGVDGIAQLGAYIDAHGTSRGYGTLSRTDADEMLDVTGSLTTTALDSLPYIPNDERRHPETQDMPDDMRLSSEFADGLVMRGSEFQTNSIDAIIARSDPPTALAVDIADANLSPALEPTDRDSTRYRHRVRAANYSQMLSRNPEASTLWLHAPGNVEAATSSSRGGDALAEVVEHGLTSELLVPPPPGAPSYATGGPIRENLLDRIIDDVGPENITSDPIAGAIAIGIAHNMEYVEGRVLAEAEDIDRVSQEMSFNYQTADLVGYLLNHEVSGDGLREALDTYTSNEMDEYFEGAGHGTWNSDRIYESELARVEELGRFNIEIALTQGMHLRSSEEDRQVAAQRRADTFDNSIGALLTGAGFYSGGWGDTAGGVSGAILATQAGTGTTLGEVIYGVNPNDLEAAATAGLEIVRERSIDLRVMMTVSAYNAGAWTSEEVLDTVEPVSDGRIEEARRRFEDEGDEAGLRELENVDWSDTDFFVGAPGDFNRDIMPRNQMTPAQEIAFLEWAVGEGGVANDAGDLAPHARKIGDVDRSVAIWEGW